MTAEYQPQPSVRWWGHPSRLDQAYLTSYACGIAARERPMSSRSVALVIGIYFLVAVSYGLFNQLREPHAVVAAVVGSAVGTGLFVLVLSGIIPIIIWAFLRFRSPNAVGPLAVWGVLGAIVIWFNWVGSEFGRQEKIETATVGIVAGGKDRDDFVRGTRNSCVLNQRENQINRQGGVTSAQIDAYCSCLAEAVAKVVSVDDLKHVAATGKPSTDMQARIDQIAMICGRTALGR